MDDIEDIYTDLFSDPILDNVDHPIHKEYHEIRETHQPTDEYIYSILLSSRTIKNDFQYCQQFNKRVNLSSQWLYCKGYQEQSQQYMVYKIRILDCELTPLHGKHLIEIENHPPMWVNSLTSFRRDILGFTDLVSFERCTFYIEFVNGDLKIIRLKLIRNMLYIHTGSETYHDTLSRRGEEQVQKLIHQIQQIYIRDMGRKPNINII